MFDYDKNIYRKLSREQLIWLIEQHCSANESISETLVESSKCHISSKAALDEIRKRMLRNKAANIDIYQNINNLKAEIDYYMGKISREEIRKILRLE